MMQGYHGIPLQVSCNLGGECMNRFQTSRFLRVPIAGHGPITGFCAGPFVKVSQVQRRLLFTGFPAGNV